MNRNLFFGLLLVLLGAVSLLVTTGYINLDWSLLVGLWPLALVFLGLALFFRSDLLYSLAGLVLIISLVSVIGRGFTWLRSPENRHAPVTQTLHTTRTIPGEATFVFSAGAGTFSIGGTSTNLAEASATTSYGRYMLTADETSSSPTVELDQEKTGFAWGAFRNSADIMLNPDPIWTINLEAGASEINYDFSAYNLRELSLKSGATSGTITFGTKADLSSATIEFGASSIKIRIPKEVGTALTLSTGLTSKELTGFSKQGNEYRSEGYDMTTKKLNLVVKAGVSDITIERY